MIRAELFTRYFLDDGIREMEQYRGVDTSTVGALAEAVREHWAHLEQMPHPVEPETESEFIFPVLGLLGWEHLPQQEPGRGRRDIADDIGVGSRHCARQYFAGNTSGHAEQY